jgi:hypothetical protein
MLHLIVADCSIFTPFYKVHQAKKNIVDVCFVNVNDMPLSVGSRIAPLRTTTCCGLPCRAVNIQNSLKQGYRTVVRVPPVVGQPLFSGTLA